MIARVIVTSFVALIIWCELLDGRAINFLGGFNDNNNDDNQKKAGRMSKKKQAQSTIILSKECHDDIRLYCPKSLEAEMTDIAILKCLHNKVHDLNKINHECQHVLYEIKKNLTNNHKLENAALAFCRSDMKKIPECKETDERKSYLATCLLSHQENIHTEACKKFIKHIGPLIFSDYRLVSSFIENCENDIRRFQCGRLEKSNDAPTEQERTIECLSFRFSELDTACKKHIVSGGEAVETSYIDRTSVFIFVGALFVFTNTIKRLWSFMHKLGFNYITPTT